MDWKKTTLKEDGSLAIPASWLHLHYYEAFNILFRIENALRVFVFIILKKEFRDEWLKQQIVFEDGRHETIENIAKKRINQAKTHGYLGYPISCPVVHLSTGELILLIHSSAYWKYFEPYFPGKQEIIKSKFFEIINVRNSLAHFRPIKQEDIDLVKLNAEHILTIIEKCISEVITCRNIVPTNTKEEWYITLKDVKTTNCKLSFQQSEDAEWIKIIITYTCPLLHEKSHSETFRWFRTLNLISPSILKLHPKLQKYLIHLSEHVPSPRITESKAQFSKEIRIVFSRLTLKDEYAEIQTEINNLLKTISEETELITKDNLAKGEIVVSAEAWASLKGEEGKKWWSFNYDELSCEFKENDPPEFWGNLGFFFALNLISKIHKYPWMSVPVSKIEDLWDI